MDVIKESEYGITLTLHSDASNFEYQNNTPSSFTNILKLPIKLDHNENYEACLTNIHIPAYQSYLLKKSDSWRNDIKFNIGLFIFDEFQSEWNLLEDSQIDLWSYNLVKDISPLELDNDVTRPDFIKRLNASFNIRERQLLKQRCLSLYNIFLKHKYNSEHEKKLIADCAKCKIELSTDLTNDIDMVRNRLKNNSNDGLPYIDFFEEFDLNKKDHVWLKHLEDLHTDEKYYLFEHLLNILNIDIYKYLRDVFLKNLNFSKIQARRYVNRIKDEAGESIKKIFDAEVYKALWKFSTGKPQLAMYVTFGDKLSDYLSIDRNKKQIITSCGNEGIYSIFKDNFLLTPKFNKEKIKSLFIYSDIVKKSVRFGDYLTNLLGIVTVDNSLYSKPATIPIYRPISHNKINSVSVKVTDENGDNPNFQPGSFAAIEIQIRKSQSQ
jgi:hypothetical protein